MFSGDQPLIESSVYLIFLPVWVETFLVYANLVIPLQQLPLAGVRDHVATQNLYVVCWWSFVSVVLQMAGFIHKTQFFLKQSSGEFVLMKESPSCKKGSSTPLKRKTGKLVDLAGKSDTTGKDGADGEFKDAESSPFVSFMDTVREEDENNVCSVSAISSRFEETECSTRYVASTPKEEVPEPAMSDALKKSPTVEAETAFNPKEKINIDNTIEGLAKPKIMPHPNHLNPSKLSVKSLDELVGERMNNLGDNYGNESIGNDYPPNHKLASLRLHRTLPCPRPLNLNNSNSTCVDAVGISHVVDYDNEHQEDKENKSDNSHQKSGKTNKTELYPPLSEDKLIIADIAPNIEDVLSSRTVIYDRDMKLEDGLLKQIPNNHTEEKLNDPTNANCLEVVNSGHRPVTTELNNRIEQFVPSQKSCEKSHRPDCFEQERQSTAGLNNKPDPTKTASNESSEKSQGSDPGTSSISGSLVDLPDLSCSGSYVFLSDFRDDTDEETKTCENHMTTKDKECDGTSSHMDLTLQSYEMILKTPEIKANRKLPTLPPTTVPVLTPGPDVLDSVVSQCDETCLPGDLVGDITPITTPCQRKRLKPNKVLFEAVNSSKNELTLPAVEIDKLERELIDTLTTFNSATDTAGGSLTNMLLEYVENEDVSLEDLEKICSGSRVSAKDKTSVDKCDKETEKDFVNDLDLESNARNQSESVVLRTEICPESIVRELILSDSINDVQLDLSTTKASQELNLVEPKISEKKESLQNLIVVEESSPCTLEDIPLKTIASEDSSSRKRVSENNPSKKSGLEDSPSKNGGLEDIPPKKSDPEDSSSRKRVSEDSPSKKSGLKDSPIINSGIENSPSKKCGLEGSPSRKSGMLTPLIGSEGELEEESGTNIWDNACEDVFDDACTALLQIRRYFKQCFVHECFAMPHLNVEQIFSLIPILKLCKIS